MQIIWLIYAYYLADFAMNELADRLQFHYGSNVPLTVLYYKAFVKNSYIYFNDKGNVTKSTNT